MKFYLMLLFSFYEGIFSYKDFIIDLTFKVKRKRNVSGQTTYIVKVSFFDVSASINSYLAFNLEKKKTQPNCNSL